MTATTSLSASTHGGARPGAGRKAGGRNAIPPERIAKDASRHAVAAVDALAGVMANPSTPGADVITRAASAILAASLHNPQPHR